MSKPLRPKNIDKSYETMDNLQAALDKFMTMPFKKGMQSAKVNEGPAFDKFSEARKAAFELTEALDTLKDAMNSGLVESTKNNRFARNVVANFLKGQI